MRDRSRSRTLSVCARIHRQSQNTAGWGACRKDLGRVDNLGCEPAATGPIEVSFVVDLHELDRTQVALVGGKGAQLGELSRIDGIRVPDGFCVTTEAFRRVLAGAPAVDDLLDRLSRVEPDGGDAKPCVLAAERQQVRPVRQHHDADADPRRPPPRRP